ncbi:MAG: M55 family metallopeptidase [Fimbriimonadaceae bacterium]|nr:M55 family metallopeptidase [Chthonomonadaceae bacterium]MCO5295265.1 M55 family metallopeptidase [Fimbriimonadaceae bacterium]
MRVYISADIEGVTGVVTWGQTGGPRSEHYDWPHARRMMTHDVNAAIRGARAAGATRIVVKDSHGGGKNLLVSDLEAGVELLSGSGSGALGMMEGVDAGFDCAMLVGYHAMAGTTAGVMEHTISGNVHRYWINGMPAGEIAMSAATAGVCEVPLVLVSSDEAGCREAEELVPALKTAVTKHGIGRYMGRLLHPSETGPRIEAAAGDAVRSAGSIAPWVPQSPVVAKIEFNRSEEADAACQLLEWERIDAYTVVCTAPDWPTAHVASRRAMAAAGTGASNNG